MSDINVTVTNAGAANVSVSNGSTVNATVGNGGAVNVSLGTISPGNATVVSGTLTINSVTTLAAGASAYVKNDLGTAYAAKLDIGIPQGIAGVAGAAGKDGVDGKDGITPSLTIGTVSTGAAGSTASVKANTTDGGSKVSLDFTIPRGDTGETGSAGSSVTLSDATPSALGTASAGTSSLAARSDHVHPQVSYASLTNVPSTFTPATHTHTASQITDFSTAVAASAPVVTVAGRQGDVVLGMADVTGLVATLDLKLDASSTIDGGEYVGAIVTPTGITITQQPQPQSAQTTSTVTFDASLAVGAAASPAAFYYDGSTLWATNPTSGTTYYTRTGGAWSSFTNGSGGGVKGYLAATSGAVIAATYGGSGSRTTNGGTSWSALTSSLRFSGLAASSSVAVGLVGPSSPTNTFQSFSTSPLVTSTDNGATWSAVSASANGAVLRAITYAGGRFMAVGTRLATANVWSGTPYDSFPAAITSTDGLTWTESSISTGYVQSASSGAFVSPLSVGFGGGRWVIVGCGPQDSPSTDSGTGVTSWYAYPKVPQVGSSVVGTRDILTSTDGTTWTRAANALPSTAIWTSVTYAAGQWLAFTSSGNTYATSSDGLTWTARALPSSKTNLGIYGNAVYDGDSFYVGGSQRVQLAVSSSTVSATFTSSAYEAGGAAISYQWQLSTDAGATWADVAGATSSTLSLTGLTTADSGKRYRVSVSATGAATVTSNAAILTVS